MNRDGYSQSFSFGPIERRGIVGGLRPAHAGLVIAGCAAAVLLVRSLPAGSGLALGMLAIASACLIAFAPVRGRTLEQWAPVLVSWATLRARGGHAYRSSLPAQGVTSALDGSMLRAGEELPESLAGCAILPFPVEGGQEIGVFSDPSLGALTAVLAVRVRAFGLLAEAEQERRLSRWGRVLAGLARNDGVIRRVCVLERTVPSDGDEMQRYLVEARDRALPSLDAAPAATRRCWRRRATSRRITSCSSRSRSTSGVPPAGRDAAGRDSGPARASWLAACSSASCSRSLRASSRPT